MAVVDDGVDKGAATAAVGVAAPRRGRGHGTGAGAATRPAAPAPPPAGTEPAPSAPRPPKRSPLPLELAFIAFLGWIYDWLQNLAPLRRAEAFGHGAAILSFEQRLGLSPERSWDHWLAQHHVLAYIASDFYDNAIFGVTFGLAAWLWWRRPDIYRPLRSYLVLANLIGFTVFWAYPVAPPRMLPGFVDVVERVGGLGSWHSTLIAHADQLAAMPSMHLAWAVWCSLVLWRLAARRGTRRLAGVAGALYPVATAWVVIATGNHYLLDVVAGAGCTAVSVLAVEAGRGRGRRWLGRRTGALLPPAGVAALPEPSAAGNEQIAVLEVPRRLAPVARTTRRPGEDDVSGPQCHTT
jgi:hypothetical protein